MNTTPLFNLLGGQIIFLLLSIDRIHFGPKHDTIFALIYTCVCYSLTVSPDLIFLMFYVIFLS